MVGLRGAHLPGLPGSAAARGCDAPHPPGTGSGPPAAGVTAAQSGPTGLTLLEAKALFLVQEPIRQAGGVIRRSALPIPGRLVFPVQPEFRLHRAPAERVLGTGPR